MPNCCILFIICNVLWGCEIKIIIFQTTRIPFIVLIKLKVDNMNFRPETINIYSKSLNLCE